MPGYARRLVYLVVEASKSPRRPSVADIISDVHDTTATFPSMPDTSIEPIGPVTNVVSESYGTGDLLFRLG